MKLILTLLLLNFGIGQKIQNGNSNETMTPQNGPETEPKKMSPQKVDIFVATTIPKDLGNLVNTIDTLIQSMNVTFNHNKIVFGTQAFFQVQESENKTARKVQQPLNITEFDLLLGQAGNQTTNSTVKIQEYQEVAKENLVNQLKSIKINVLDSLVRQTSEFMSFFNQTATMLTKCDWKCLSQCNTTVVDGTLLIQQKVNCLDLCGCFQQQSTLTQPQQQQLEELPISNKTLLHVVEKLKTTKNLTADDLEMQIQIAKEIYRDELTFERQAHNLDNRGDILDQLATVFPDEYVQHLRTRLNQEREVLIRQRVLARLQTTLESLEETTMQTSQLAEGLIQQAQVQLGCNITCIDQCIATRMNQTNEKQENEVDSGRSINQRYQCMNECLCFKAIQEPFIPNSTTQLATINTFTKLPQLSFAICAIAGFACIVIFVLYKTISVVIKKRKQQQIEGFTRQQSLLTQQQN